MSLYRGGLVPALLAAGLVFCGVVSQAVAEDQLIPRAALFSDNTRYDAVLSADGARYAWSAEYEGVPAVWVADLTGPGEARPVTPVGAPVPQFAWSAHPDVLLVMGDNTGDERWRVSALNVRSGERLDLTPGTGERASVRAISALDVAHIVIASNERDATHPDLFRVNILNGDRERILFNDAGYSNFLVGADLQPRIGVRVDPDTGDYHLDALGAAGEARALADIAYEDTRGFELLSVAVRGHEIYLRDSTGRDTSALVAMSLETGERRVLASNDRADIVEVITDPLTGRPLAYAHDYAGKLWEALDVIDRRLFDRFGELDGRVDFGAWRADGQAFTLYVTGAAPSAYVRVDRESGEMTHLVDIHPDLEGYEFTRKQAEIINTRDGQEMVAWLTLPHGSDTDGDGRPDQPVPLIVMPHGGPWDQSREAFDPWQQWLANRGYAVLSPNFRGSTGYGKAWLNAGDQEWGGVIQNDVIDASRWAVEAGIADPDRIGIWGASFGGYMVLRTLSNTPDEFACGASGAGSTDLTTLYNSLPEYWTAFLGEYRRRVADPTTEVGQALSRAHSPLYEAHQITAPLLIAQGAEDSRVPRAESEQIVSAMIANGQPVTYLLFEGEGHGNRLAANNRAALAIREHFFAACLGGRTEPYNDDLAGSTITIPEGAEHVPGLASALSARGE